ncbi:unnamed protein product [Paramecium pentaurelia]|uniref:Transmembrane protein n=1 Tax=Paramecium pentaurelia TaxID=43138 RepID=A0A8S1SRG9_9CILI|nr:unnamed protein product [Paramecium pentaurelia]
MIFFILQTVLAKELTNLTTHFLFNKISESEQINIVVTEQLNIRDYPQAKYVIDAKLESKQKGSVCFVKQGSIQFGDYSIYSQKIFELPNLQTNDPELLLNIPVLLNMVHIKKAIAIVTSNNQILLYRVNKNSSNIIGHEIQLEANYSFQHLRQEAKIIEPPQMIYTDQTQYIYLIYRNQIIGGKVNYDNLSSFVLRNITNQGFENDNNYLGQVKVFGWHIFVPIGVDGLDIYQYEENGELTLIGNMNSTTFYNQINNIKIVDVVFGGFENQKYMYVLDQLSGITRFIVSSNSSGFTAQLDSDLGFIQISHGTTLAEHNNSYILILQERGVINTLVEIGLYQNDWFKVKVHYLTGKYSEIDILPEFTILRGKDEHRIIRTGIYEKFEPSFVFTQKDNVNQEKQNSFYEEYVFIPSLITMDFYDVDKGALNITNNFNYNITNSFLIGITSQSIIYMPYIIENPYIRCNPRTNRSIGRSFDYKLNINATHCPQKEKLIGIPPQLILCQYVDEFNLKITNGDGIIYDTETLASIMMGFIVLLIMLSILLAYLYSRYKIKKTALQNDIQGFGESVNREGYDMDQQYSQQ